MKPIIMVLLGLVILLSLWSAETTVFTGVFPPYQPYQWPIYQNPYRPAPPAPPRPEAPIVPGSPQWKRLQFIKRYQASQRSRTTDVEFGPKSTDKIAFEKTALMHQNMHRLLHNARELNLDHKLSKEAAQYAYKLASDMRIAHSKPKDRPYQSENIAAGCKISGPGLTAFEAVKYWYQTVCNHNWYRPSPNDKSRPFTNMVWRSTRRFGIGYASFKTKDGFNCTVIVGRYSPEGSGETISEYRKNVLKGYFVPTACQYVNDRDKPEFMQPSVENCKPSKDFHGQMVEKESTCSFSQLFNAFGASRRKGKLAFRVVL